MLISKKLKRLIAFSMIAGSLAFAPEIYNCPAIYSVAYAEVQSYEGVGEFEITGERLEYAARPNTRFCNLKC